MPSRRLGLVLAFCTSVCAHGVAYASLSVPKAEMLARRAVSELNFELLPRSAAVPEKPADAPSTAAAPNAWRGGPATRTAPANPHPKPSTEETRAAPPASPALDLSGVTLSNETGIDFGMPLGDGSALHGPIGLGASRAPSIGAPPATATAATLPPLVDQRDLSESPRPPSLAGLLRANYPDEARQRGLRGSARLRARIGPDGVIHGAWILSENAAGFGAACRRTVLGSHWSTPRDKNGRAVATEIVYTCHFEVDQ